MKLISDNELYHHGVVGMKWGIRRFQPYSLIPRGSGKGGNDAGALRFQRGSVKYLAKAIRPQSDKSRAKNIDKLKKSIGLTEGIEKQAWDHAEASLENRKKLAKAEREESEFRDRYNTDDELYEKYYKKVMDKRIDDDIKRGILDPEKDKAQIDHMRNPHTLEALEFDTAEEAYKMYKKDRGEEKDLEEAREAAKAIYTDIVERSKSVVNSYLGEKLSDMDVKTGGEIHKIVSSIIKSEGEHYFEDMAEMDI